MTDKEMIDRLVILTGGESEVLELLITNCKDIAVTYCNLSSYSSKLDEIVILMATERYNKWGEEGIKTRSFSGVSESYNDDFSDTIYKALRRHKRIRTA